jgi:IS30 family transposase
VPKDKRKPITEEQWKRAAEAFELGTMNGSQIARELGISPATVSREFKRRGCVKASRVAETIAPLEVSLNAKLRRRARQQSAKETAALDRLALINAMIDDMVKSVLAADGADELALAGSKVREVGKALGVKGLR